MSKHYNHSEKEIALRALKVHKQEAAKGTLFVSIHRPMSRTAKVVGIPVTTLRRWSFAAESPCQLQPTACSKQKILDDFDLDVIQRCLLDMFNERIYVTQVGYTMHKN